MIKYRLHNITDFGVEIHEFYTEKSLNNYIAIFVDPPYWVENLETHEKVYTGYSSSDKPNQDNVSRETFHESEIDWIKRHIPTEEKVPCTKIEKISSFLCVILFIIIASIFLYLFLYTVSFVAEYCSAFKWEVFSVL